MQPFPLIFAGEVSGNRALLDVALESSDLALRSFYEVQRSSTAVGLVAQRVGAAVVPALALQKGAYPSVRTVDLTQPTVSRTLVLVARKTAQLSPAAQALYDMRRDAGSLQSSGGLALVERLMNGAPEKPTVARPCTGDFSRARRAGRADVFSVRAVSICRESVSIRWRNRSVAATRSASNVSFSASCPRVAA